MYTDNYLDFRLFVWENQVLINVLLYFANYALNKPEIDNSEYVELNFR
jgi:hypothetical protein